MIKKLQITSLFIICIQPISLISTAKSNVSGNKTPRSAKGFTASYDSSEGYTSSSYDICEDIPSFDLTTKEITYNALDQKKITKEFNEQAQKMLKKMSEEELTKTITLALKLDKYDEAIRYLEKLHTVTQSTRVAQTTLLTLGDVFFKKGVFKKAAEKYTEYASLYANDKQTEYSKYKGLLSNFNIMLELDRDQTATRNTIALAESFLEKNEHYKQYTHDVKEILALCYTKLYDHQLHVFDYYMHRGRFKAAATRLKAIEKEFSQKITDFEPKIIHLKYRLAQAQNEPERAQQLEQKLTTHYPHYALILESQTKKPKRNYLAFF